MKNSPSLWQARKEELLIRLQKTKASWLGFTEPTLCARSGVRLHEEDPTKVTAVIPVSSEELILRKAEYAASQYQLGLPQQTGMLSLPRLVQYDLAHLAEGLPETRTQATTDQMHSFLSREQANETLLEHLTAYHALGSVPCLVWHAFHPVHGNKSIYEMPGVDPFEATKEAGEQELLIALATHLHQPTAEWPAGLTALQREVLTTMQAKLERIAAFANKLADADITAIFRPYHEANGHWFWWAINRFSENKEEAAALFWQLWCNTRTFLEDRCGVHNLVYAWSPNIDGSWFKEDVDLIELYSRGVQTEAIDILGVDCYSNNLRCAKDALLSQRREVLLKGLEVISALRRAFPDKPVGFTELGLRYHELLTNDLEEEALGGVNRGGGSLNDPFFRRFCQWAKYPPHFTIFWRNEPHSLEFPLAGLSDEMDEEVRGILENFNALAVPVSGESFT